MSFSQKKYRLRWGVVLTLLSLLHVGCAQGNEATALPWHMPQQADAIHLTWVKGPPQLQAFNQIDQHLAGFREDDAVLAFRSEQWGMLLDPRQMTIERLTVTKTADVVLELLDWSKMQQTWALSQLELSAEVDGKVYHAVAGPIPPLKDDYSYSPIHIVESGDWFQHVAIYDLELLDADGAKLPAKVWLEIRAWGDRCLFEWCVEPENGKSLELQVGLKSQSLQSAEFAKATGTRVQLGLDFSDESIRPIVVDDQSVQISAVATDTFALGQPKIEYSAVNDAWEVILPKLDWPNKNVAAYNSDLLDRISHYDLKLANTTDAPRDVCLRFIHDYHPATGYVPMLLDTAGKQTGLPLQNSKNWHDFRPHPYYGMWFNITARLTLAPNANVDFKYIVAHAQWQGVPASSAAQLSLVGWGYNGFWTEMALGSWGESVCIQAGRTMRRAFITDVRPFDVIGRNGLPYDWTSNVGGGDIGKIVDDQGKLITWQGSVREFAMIGPNLSHVRVTERSAKDRMRLQIDSYLPRSNSINRSYFKVKLEVIETVAFNELALFQLGSDYYNEMESTKIAWGNLNGLSGEVSPAAAQWGTVMEPVQLSGEQPWVSLHANAPEPKAGGRAVRGIVIRDYRAELGGKVYDAPWIASARTKKRLNAELVLPPEIKQLKAGDTVEFTVEMDILPFSADAYCGADAALKQRLEATPDSWQLTAFEAQHQQVRINGKAQAFPATYALTAARQQTFTVSSHSKMDTVCVTGLANPDSWKLEELVEGKSVPLGERFKVEAQPQITYVPETGTWTAVLSLVFPEGSHERSFRLNI
ncbi:MAG: hypothetical protein ABS34_03770 [Opitutaceae bacterium BACL24 MAG-120322-bin51]|nr:MAG: hypothetical protein ABS34_03770 [Opitutaceae bacterium BACL24 MAG-120322-bin51]